MTIRSAIQDGIISVLQFVKELKYAKKRDLGLKCRVKLIDDNRTIQDYPGIMSDTRKFVFCEQLGRIQINPVLYLENGLETVYMPKRFHGNPDYNRLEQFAGAQTNEALLQWKNAETWVTMRVVTKGSIDWNLFDNDFSFDFGADAFQVTRGSIFDSVVKQTPNFKLLLIALSCFLLGYVLGFGSETVFSIIIFIILRVIGV